MPRYRCASNARTFSFTSPCNCAAACSASALGQQPQRAVEEGPILSIVGDVILGVFPGARGRHGRERAEVAEGLKPLDRGSIGLRRCRDRCLARSAQSPGSSRRRAGRPRPPRGLAPGRASHRDRPGDHRVPALARRCTSTRPRGPSESRSTRNAAADTSSRPRDRGTCARGRPCISGSRFSPSSGPAGWRAQAPRAQQSSARYRCSEPARLTTRGLQAGRRDQQAGPEALRRKGRTHGQARHARRALRRDPPSRPRRFGGDPLPRAASRARSR